MKSLKQLVIAGLALFVFLGTFGLENVFAGQQEMQLKRHPVLVVPSGAVDVLRKGLTESLPGGSQKELQAGDTVQVKSGSSAEIHFSDRGLVRLSPDARVNVDVLDTEHDAYVFNLKKGRLWANNIYTSAVMNIVANGAYVIPDFAAVDVNISDQKTLVYAQRHEASIGLVPLDYQAKSLKVFPDGDFINSYLLPQGNQTTVFADKIVQNESTLRKLFYSKLVKEFPFGAIDPQILSTDDWLKQNIVFDKTFDKKIQDESSQQIRSRGLKIADVNSFGYSFGQALNRFYNFLTFSGDKVIARTRDDIFDHFDDAKYLLLFGQTTSANEHLIYFKKFFDEALRSQGPDFLASVLDRLRAEYDQLSYVTPDDPLASAKSVLNTYLLAQLGSSQDAVRQKFLLVRNTMNGVYDLADKGSHLARQALEDYYAQFIALSAKEIQNLGSVKNILAEENQNMNNLFLQYPVFYSDRFFAMKNQLEQQWLALLPDGEDKNEEKQTIVSQKIDFLRQLQTFFLADKITVDDAKQIVFRLFREADDLQLPQQNQVAVNELYAQRLQDFGVFYRYLNSTEYVATTLHGASRKNQFSDFVKAQQEQVSIEQIRQEILGNQTVPAVTPDMILAQAQKDFAGIGAADVVFGLFNDISQKIIPLNGAVIGGITIRAVYNWDSKLVSQIYTGDTLISEAPVNLGSLELLVRTKTQQPLPQTQQPLEPQPTPTPAQQPAPAATKTERVAKILLMQKLKTNDIAATEGGITIVDLGKSLFALSGAILVSDQSVNFNFDVDGKNGLVTNLVVQTVAGPKPVEGTLNLADVSAQVKATVKAAK